VTPADPTITEKQGHLDAASSVLASVDNVMDSLVSQYGLLAIQPKSPFATLCRSIIAQQVSTRAADTIRRRLEVSVGMVPENVAASSMEHLRSIGLSPRKATCLKDVARRAIAGDFDGLDPLTDEIVVRRLVSISGVGPWTAEMFLIFALARPDIWPLSDAGLLAACKRRYGIGSRDELAQLGERFRPFRTVAALYLWRSLENTSTAGAQ
jgi:DNA-3-methyladenine glycosylase II